MSRRNRHRLSMPTPGAAPPPATAAQTDHAAALYEAIRFYRARDPDGWNELALCPLQHGLDTIATRLRALR